MNLRLWLNNKNKRGIVKHESDDVDCGLNIMQSSKSGRYEGGEKVAFGYTRIYAGTRPYE